MMQSGETAQMGHIPHNHQAHHESMHHQRQSVHHSSAKMHAAREPSSSKCRILMDVACEVCKDHSSGKHYGIFACDGCAGFFKRSIRRDRTYACKAKDGERCTVDKPHRNQCRACRLEKCIRAGMNRDAVQHERGPRNSTLRRQMSLYSAYGKEQELMSSMMPPPSHAALDLVLPKPSSRMEPQVSLPPAPLAHHPAIPQTLFLGLTSKVSMTPPLVPPAHQFLIRAIDTICEKAANLLINNISFVKGINAGSGLCAEDQLTVLEASWAELFLLAAAQYMPNLDPSPLIPLTAMATAYGSLSIAVRHFREILISFNAHSLNPQEYKCLFAVVMYKAGLDCEPVPSSCSSASSMSPGGSRLRDTAAVVKLRDDAQRHLGDTMDATSAYGAVRFSRLILDIPKLRQVPPQSIDDFFFKRTVGPRPIEEVICDMYRKDTTVKVFL